MSLLSRISLRKFLAQVYCQYEYWFIIMTCLLFISTIACNPEDWEFVNCSECYTNKPAEAEINVKLSISNLNPSVVINLYSGKIEEELLILTDTVNNETWSAIVPVDEYYTVTATYRALTGNFWVTAIDGGTVRLRKVRASCDNPCWVIRGNNFNVKLKY